MEVLVTGPVDMRRQDRHDFDGKKKYQITSNFETADVPLQIKVQW